MNNLIDLHSHSVLSTHAFSSVTENIEWASSKGLKYFGVSEHQYDDKRIGAHYYAFNNLKALPRFYKGMYIFRGCEFNILEDGSIDKYGLRDHDLDYGIASMHSYTNRCKDVDINTNAYLKALEDRDIKILGHIDDGSHPCDFDKVIKATKDAGKLIELNNSSLNPWGCRPNAASNMREIIRICKDIGQNVIINSDAHICYDVGNFDLVLSLLEEQDFPKEQVLNFNEDLILKYFKVIERRGFLD